jgi:hypothetical protein
MRSGRIRCEMPRATDRRYPRAPQPRRSGGTRSPSALLKSASGSCRTPNSNIVLGEADPPERPRIRLVAIFSQKIGGPVHRYAPRPDPSG